MRNEEYVKLKAKASLLKKELEQFTNQNESDKSFKKDSTDSEAEKQESSSSKSEEEEDR
jgi:hypothetical protein